MKHYRHQYTDKPENQSFWPSFARFILTILCFAFIGALLGFRG